MFIIAELLEAVAIIGVLVAISIPIFTSQLEKSREAVDAANIRAKYAEVMADVVAGNYNETTNKPKTGEENKDGYTVTLKQQKAGWVSTYDWQSNLDGTFTIPDSPNGKTATLTYSSTEGKVKVTIS